MSIQRIGPRSAGNRSVQLLSNKWSVLVLLSTCFVDFICCLVLLLLTSFTATNAQHAFLDWKHNTFDLFALLCLRLALIFVIRFVMEKQYVNTSSHDDNYNLNNWHSASDVTLVAVV